MEKYYSDVLLALCEKENVGISEMVRKLIITYNAKSNHKREKN